MPTARELGVGIVPYSPLGRGELTGAVEIAAEDDTRQTGYFPRFQRENRDRNLRLVERAGEIAAEAGCTPAQLALAWLLHQGDDVVPIPGTRRTGRLEENAAAVELELSEDQLSALDETFAPGVTAGDRYTPDGMASVEL